MNILTKLVKLKKSHDSIDKQLKQISKVNHNIMAKRKKTPFFITLLEVVNNGRAYYADTLAHRAAINKRDDGK